MRVGFDGETYLAAISPCPNDTFIFGAWVLGMAGDVLDLRTRFIWEDIQTLNEMAAAGTGDLVKVSAVQALKLEQDWDILSCGGAFGLGHGPKLVAVKKAKTKLSTIAVPGMLTTAFALLKDCLDFDFEPVPMPFDQIPSAVVGSQVDAGLLIHETALIADQLGLNIILDLGMWWEERSSGLPLPLGLIIIKKSLGQKLKLETEKIIQDSITMARQGKPGIRSFIKQLARELDDDVINRHIKAYVNEYSTNMGEQGIRALSLLKKIA